MISAKTQQNSKKVRLIIAYLYTVYVPYLSMYDTFLHRRKIIYFTWMLEQRAQNIIKYIHVQWWYMMYFAFQVYWYTQQRVREPRNSDCLYSTIYVRTLFIHLYKIWLDWFFYTFYVHLFSRLLLRFSWICSSSFFCSLNEIHSFIQ